MFKKKKPVEVESDLKEVDVGVQPPKPSGDVKGKAGFDPEVAKVIDYFQAGFSGVYSVPASPGLTFSAEACALLLALLVEQRKVSGLLEDLLKAVREE